MKVLDVRLNNNPTSDDVKGLAEARIRNLLCFDELKHFNKKGEFKRVHPIVENRLEYAELTALWLNDSIQFFKQYKNCTNNIFRYVGRLNSPIYEQKKEQYQLLLEKHRKRESIFHSITKGNFLKIDKNE